jgi:DNA primase
MPQWVNYKEIKSEIAFIDVLDHYKLTLKVKGDQATGFCPLPGHNGTRKSPSFSANLARGAFQCFGCGAKGNVIDFIALMENLDPKSKGDFHKAALLARDQFMVKGRERQSRPTRRSQKEADTRPVRVNPPLDFALKGLNQRHPYLAQRGFRRETVIHFGLGYCTRGMLKERIAIPLHDTDGNLIGYAGRLVDDAAVTGENPKYKMPSMRERDGVVYEFRKSLFLYNRHRLPPSVSDLVVVEGFPSVWWLWQETDAHVVSLMGASCSDEQARLIVEAVEPDGRVWIMPDGNEAGERCGLELLKQVAIHRFVRWVRLTDGNQPTDLTAENLDGLIGQC